MAGAILDMFSYMAMELTGHNTIILGLVLLGFYGYLMFAFRIPASFAFVAGIILLTSLTQLSPIFQGLDLLLMGIAGVLFISFLLKITRS